MRVAVLGAGYAGLTVACRLERSLPDGAELVVVDESPDHVVQHELHRLIRHPELADVVSVPLSDVLSRARIEQATVVDVDTDGGVAALDYGDREETLRYDFAAVCLGAETEFYGLDGVETYATPLKRIDHAKTIRADALDAAGGEAIVGGGGLSGIQTAGELAELSEAKELDLDVTIVEMADQLAPGFDPTFAEAIRGELAARDVAVETGVAIESADESIVHLEDGRSLTADVFVWTGGIRGPDSLDGERVKTAGDMRVSESTFVVGDAAAVTDSDGTAVPASAQTAVREGGVVANNISQLLGGDDVQTGTVSIRVTDDSGEEAVETTEATDTPTEGDSAAAEQTLERYSYRSPGWVVSVGDGAVAKVGPFVFSGEPAKATKAGIGAGHLGSVGAISKASKLVAEELGWPTADVFGIAEYLDGRTLDRLGADPSAPSQLSEPLVGVLDGLSSALAAGETIDITPLTREADPDYPGSAMNTLRGIVMGSSVDIDDSVDADSVEIQIEDESGTDGDSNSDTDQSS